MQCNVPILSIKIDNTLIIKQAILHRGDTNNSESKRCRGPYIDLINQRPRNTPIGATYTEYRCRLRSTRCIQFVMRVNNKIKLTSHAKKNRVRSSHTKGNSRSNRR